MHYIQINYFSFLFFFLFGYLFIKEVNISLIDISYLCLNFFEDNLVPYCTINSKINDTRKVIHLPISKLHSILAVANLLAHNNKSQICYCGQISLQIAAVFLTPLGVTFILLAMLHLVLNYTSSNFFLYFKYFTFSKYM